MADLSKIPTNGSSKTRKKEKLEKKKKKTRKIRKKNIESKKIILIK